MEDVAGSANVPVSDPDDPLSWRSVIAGCLVLFVLGLITHEVFLSGAAVTLIPTLAGLRRSVHRTRGRRAFLLAGSDDALAPWDEREFGADFAKDFLALVPNALLVVFWGGGVDMALSFRQFGAVAASILGLMLASTTVVRLGYEGTARLHLMRRAGSKIREVTMQETLEDPAAARRLPMSEPGT